MLLRHTTDEVIERKALTVNPAKTCQPIGAMYAAFGIHGCLPHSHGSQGCCAYHRSALTRHYKEPVMASTSSFTEGSSVFGGQANMLTAIDTIFSVYDPEVIAIHTTCLSETIGDDLTQIRKKAMDKGLIPEGKNIIHCNTPSYVGSHVTGFSNMCKGMVDYFAESTENKSRQINVLPGWVEPSDMGEIKHLLRLMDVEYVMFPDTDGVLNAPQTGEHEFFPRGGATVEQIRSSGDSLGTIALGPTCSRVAAHALETKCDVPAVELEIPYGVKATDRFIAAVQKMARVPVPQEINDERGRLMDLITDMHQYLHGKRVALWGDPDQLVSLVEFLTDLDMRPVYIVTGSSDKKLENRITQALAERVPEAKFRKGMGADMFLMHQWIKEEPVDLLIGNTYGKYISRDENIPFVRHGFPILDRVGHQYYPTVGYRGAVRFIEMILNAVMDKQDRESPEESFELVM